MKEIQKRVIDNFYQNIETAIPTTLNVEVTNICNLDCIMCPAHHIKRKKGYLDLGLYKSFLDEAIELGIKQVGLFSTGESVLHHQFPEFVKVTVEKGLYAYLDVNGNYFREGQIEAIIDAGLSSMKFSIDAHNSEIYDQIRQGGDFNKVIENLKKVDAYRKLVKSEMKLFSLYIISSINEKYIDNFKEIISPYVDEIGFSLILNQGDQIDNAVGLQSHKLREIIKKNTKPILCPNPWKRLNLSWDGYLSACCIDFEMQLEYGKYIPGKLHEIWQNDRINKIRSDMSSRNFESSSICKNCDMINYDIPKIFCDINKLY
ncbi:MAG: radical SAM protein [gamma proteobacterium symbiont of Taylorina sp.]|nr:radical SAM protein [gamma proteobacterium symbiont of Taylorina sp.]